MAAMTLLNQDHMVAGSVAPAPRWSAIDGGSRLRLHAPVGIAPKTATNVVKPFHGYARRPSEGSS
jgi:hypothetical protein